MSGFDIAALQESAETIRREPARIAIRDRTAARALAELDVSVLRKTTKTIRVEPARIVVRDRAAARTLAKLDVAALRESAEAIRREPARIAVRNGTGARALAKLDVAALRKSAEAIRREPARIAIRERDAARTLAKLDVSALRKTSEAIHLEPTRIAVRDGTAARALAKLDVSALRRTSEAIHLEPARIAVRAGTVARALAELDASALRKTTETIRLEPARIVFHGRAAARALATLDFAALRESAETVLIEPARRAIPDRAASRPLSQLDVTGTRVAAGNVLRHPETTTMEETMKGIRRRAPARAHPQRHQDYKSRLLDETIPDVDTRKWSDDVYMIRRGDDRHRIQMRDRGWLEVDEVNRRVRTWGRPGRAADLAAAIAESRGWTVAQDRPAFAATAPADRPPPRPSTDLESWWRERGYDAIADREGVWVDVGEGSQLQDAGSRVIVHGGLTDEAARALVLKAREHWDGSAELAGTWSVADQDRLWLEAQRAGVQLGRCSPSAEARAAWEAESAAAVQREETLAQVRAATGPAQDLKDAAMGDVAAFKRLDPDLQTFVKYYIDDAQRRVFAGVTIEDIIPELPKFRKLGAEDREAARQEFLDEAAYDGDEPDLDLDEIAPIPQAKVPG